MRPVEHKCIGFKCKENDYYCIDRCPEKALTLRLNPVLETLGDYRWTAEMLIGHWEMAEPEPLGDSTTDGSVDSKTGDS